MPFGRYSDVLCTEKHFFIFVAAPGFLHNSIYSWASRGKRRLFRETGSLRNPKTFYCPVSRVIRFYPGIRSVDMLPEMWIVMWTIIGFPQDSYSVAIQCPELCQPISCWVPHAPQSVFYDSLSRRECEKFPFPFKRYPPDVAITAYSSCVYPHSISSHSTVR